jgi:murein DD-endopeptidase MepM/ murein hydrolase activator NlpD
MKLRWWLMAVGAAFLGVWYGVIVRFHSEFFPPAFEAALPSVAPVVGERPVAQPEDDPLMLPRVSYCEEKLEARFANSPNIHHCTKPPKLTARRGIEVNLTANTALLFEEGKLIAVEPLLYQAPEGKWFQAPTGYYAIGAKRELHRSSLFPVAMPWSLQYYEDFFMHGIPYHGDGTRVTNTFTGGCLRFTDEVAERLYSFLRAGDQVAVYKTFDDLVLKSEFHAPVDLSRAWIRQRYVNPYRSFYNNSGSIETLREDYYSHTGVDFALDAEASDTSAYAIADGVVALVQENNGTDHGLGRTVIVAHEMGEKQYYALYAHLARIEDGIVAGAKLTKGQKIGAIGNSGNGCEHYWKIGPDGCKTNAPYDTHLHFELKEAAVLENPKGGEACRRSNGSTRYCYGYTPEYPEKYGYFDPIKFMFDKKEEDKRVYALEKTF